MDKKIVVNYFYNILYQVIKMIIPLIVLPYTYSHITPRALGIYDYAFAISEWFILAGMLGINTYGNREIARVRDNKYTLSKAFKEISFVQKSDVTFALFAFIIFSLIFIDDNKIIFLIVSLHIFANLIDITWFYYGIEDFKSASLRNLFIKSISIILIFLFCKTEQDLYVYSLICVGMEVIGQALLYVNLHKYVDNIKINYFEAYRNHFVDSLRLFIPTIAISVYTMLDQTMIGTMCAKEELEFYKTSLSFIKMFLYFITALGTVMLPRITNIYFNSGEDEKEIEHIINNTIRISLLLAIPMFFGMFIVSNPFISLYLPNAPMVGNLIGFGCIIVIFMSVSNVLGIQYLIAVGNYKAYTTCVIAGAIVNFFINLSMIPFFGAYGAMFGTIVAEALVAILEYFATRKTIEIRIFSDSLFKSTFASIIMSIMVYMLINFSDVSFARLMLYIILGGLLYLFLLIIAKEPLTIKTIRYILLHKSKRRSN